jgi:hypothetical protein
MSSHPLRPHRALLHPLWVGALVVLACNDHWWKFSNLLPAPVTGKLSDFAGMLVAPVLLAALVGVRRRSGLLAAHVAVGVVFTMIQLSRPFADVWSAAMGLVGMPWIITCDPTDLVALPALWIGMRVFPRAMQRSAVASLRRTGEVGAAGIGLFCCVATSSENQPIDPEMPFLDEIEADVYVHNGTDEELVVRIRPLTFEIAVDCEIIANDPGRLLSEVLFDTAQSWTVPADANVAVFPAWDGAPCHAAIIEADGWPTRLAFWHDAALTRGFVSGTGIDPDADGWIDLSRDGDDEGVIEAGLDILFRLEDAHAPVEGVCAVQEDGDRNAWSDDVPYGAWSLTAIEPGLDGCTGFGLAQPGDELESKRWFLCTPELELPFAVGDAIEIDPLPEYELQGMRIRAVQIDTLTPVEPAREVVVSRGAAPTRIADLEATFSAKSDCQFTVDECGTVARGGVLVLGGPGWPTAQLGTGESIVLEHVNGAVVRLALAHGQERNLVDPSCALGPAAIGADVEIAATYVGTAQ